MSLAGRSSLMSELKTRRLLEASTTESESSARWPGVPFRLIGDEGAL